MLFGGLFDAPPLSAHPTGLFWVYVVLKSFMSGHFQTHSFWVGVGMDVSAILFGALCMALFRNIVLVRKGD